MKRCTKIVKLLCKNGWIIVEMIQNSQSMFEISDVYSRAIPN